jgi:hypothetical protein
MGIYLIDAEYTYRLMDRYYNIFPLIFPSRNDDFIYLPFTTGHIYQVGTKGQRYKGTKFFSFPSVPAISVAYTTEAYTTENRYNFSAHSMRAFLAEKPKSNSHSIKGYSLESKINMEK